MSEPLKRQPMQIMVIISSAKLSDKVAKMLLEDHLPVFYRTLGEGTASSEIMDMLGLGSTSKAMLLCVMPKSFAKTVLEKLKSEFGFGGPNTGVAFTMMMSGISSPIMRLLNDSVRKELQETMEKNASSAASGFEYSLITAVVNQGCSEMVMDAARGAGAGGGTVLHAHQICGEKAMSFWGVSIQEEKDIVLIVAKTESKLAIMKAIGESCGSGSEASGIVFSAPIDALVGM